jgi:hypothetical protein
MIVTNDSNTKYKAGKSSFWTPPQTFQNCKQHAKFVSFKIFAHLAKDNLF